LEAGRRHLWKLEEGERLYGHAEVAEPIERLLPVHPAPAAEAIASKKRLLWPVALLLVDLRWQVGSGVRHTTYHMMRWGLVGGGVYSTAGLGGGPQII
jgi:hypothetical protein